MFGGERKSPDTGISDIRKGVEEFEQSIQDEDATLRELFVSLKTDLLDEFLQPHTSSLSHEHIRILRQQIDHVMELAERIGYKELVKSFKEEESLLRGIESILDEFPRADVSSNPDLHESLEKMRLLMRNQQALIFDRHGILAREKQDLIDILGQVNELKELRRREALLDPGKS